MFEVSTLRLCEGIRRQEGVRHLRPADAGTRCGDWQEREVKVEGGQVPQTKEKQEAIDYSTPKVSTHVAPDELSDEAYSALVQSLIDDEDGVDAEFSMLKCQMIEDGTYFE